LQADGSRIPEPESPEHYSFDDSGWRQLDLPHDWGIEGPFRTDLEGFTGKLPWRGIGWYRKHFNIPAGDKGKQYYLDFDGAMANAEIWLNGKKVGGRPYGYISFRVDLTPYVRWGEENVVAVRLDTEKLGSRWYPGAGIYRHVRLVVSNPVHVAQWGVFVTTPQITDEEGVACVHVKIQNKYSEEKECSYTVDIYELDENDVPGKRVTTSKRRNLSLSSGGFGLDSVLLKVSSPKRWSLEHTNRYLASVKVYKKKKLIDVYDATFGFRTIQFTHDNGFLLNGKRVQINGTCNHHDLGALGTAVHTAALKRQLLILKSMGCNALRTSHNPPTPELLTLADKL
ncbi:MAG: beta-galactosidase, partial [Phocaeicola sp.]|nr:beta-galactosidase [Phocaeicola sp.]